MVALPYTYVMTILMWIGLFIAVLLVKNGR